MRKFIMLLTAITLLSSVANAVTLDYGASYYRSHMNNQYNNSASNPIYLALDEIEDELTSIVAGTGTDLDDAYNQGYAIDVDGTAITLTVSDTDNNVALIIAQNDSTNDPDAMQITSAADAATAVGLQIDCTAGYDIQGTSDSWNISIAGVATLAGVTATGEIQTTADVLFNGTYDVAWDVNRNQFIFQDSAVCGFGGAHDAAADITLTYDGAGDDLDIAFDDKEIAFGSSGAGGDVIFYTETASTYVMIDEDADELLLVLADLKISQGSQIEFIDVTDGLTDWTMDNATDETLLIMPTETTDDQTINLGDADHTTDLRIFGKTASTIVYDASADKVTFDAYDIATGDGDYIIFGDSSDITLSYDGTGNDLELTEADGAAILSLIGFEANEGQIHILADQDDDATDGWEIASSVTGTLTIGNDSSVAGTFVDKLTIAGATGNLTLTGDITNENADVIVMSTDDKLSFQSNDEYSTFQALGFEAKEATLELLADQDDDATDGWEIAALVDGTLTIGNDSAVAGTFVDKLTIDGATGNLTLTGDIVNENADTLVMSGDDILQFTSNDGAATIQVLGFEANNAVLSLAADEADDAGDTWTFTVADAGALTIANDGTATMTINEVVALGSGMTSIPVVVTDAAEYDVLAANSGRVHIITDLSQNTTIDLPAEAAGLYYKFIYAGGSADSHDHTIDSENAANYFLGGVAFADNDAGDAADEIHAGIYSDGNSNSKLTINNAAAGTEVNFYCQDGTLWYVWGQIVSDTAPAFADQ